MDMEVSPQLYRSDSILLSDTNYYKFIFKKTEKIVCAVFYVLENADKGREGIVQVSALGAAKETLDAVLRTLSCRWYTAYDELYTFLSALIALESNVRVAQAVGLMQEEIADMLTLEIQTVLRSLRQYLAYEKKSAPNLTSLDTDDQGREAMRTSSASAPEVRTTKSVSQQTAPNKGQHFERRRIIKDILSINNNATIKDISVKVPDWSEKTLQREITAMIKDGIIIKDGERRWSRYSLAANL